MPSRLIKIGRTADIPFEPSAVGHNSNGASVLTRDVSLAGNISGGDLQVDGLIKGEVRVTRLFIGEEGRIEGSIHADVVEVRGRVSGSITAKQVRLHATAYLEGDLFHEQLTIETGAFFDGRSQTIGHKNPPQPQPPPAAHSDEA